MLDATLRWLLSPLGLLLVVLVALFLFVPAAPRR
jgi:hypothetical protein